LNGNNVAYENSTRLFFVALGGSGYATCAEGSVGTLTCTMKTLPSGLGRVDDLAVADGFVFLLNSEKPQLAVVRVNGDVAQTPISVPGTPSTGVSASGGKAVVSGGTSRLQTFTYTNAGVLQTGPDADYGLGQPDVYQPNGNTMYVSTDFDEPRPNGLRFGITVARLPDLKILNQIGLQDSFPERRRGGANFPVVSTSYSSAGQGVCLVAISPESGLVVVCNPESSNSSRRFDIPGTSGARGVAVGGDRAFVVKLVDGDLSLITLDLSPINNGNTPVSLDTKVLVTSLSPPVAVAASLDGTTVVVAANSAGILLFKPSQ